MQRRLFLKYAGSAGIGISLGSAGLSEGPVKSNSSVTETERKVPVAGEYDVIVCGAGPAGVSAAVEAGRNGARTLLVEAHGSLGGIWTSGLLTWILDHTGKSGFMREIEEKLKSGGGVSTGIDTGRVLSFDPEIMKLLLEELCLEADVNVLFHSRVVSSLKDNRDRLTHIITESKSGREAWKAEVFIDSTGDGDLAALSGCGFDLGRDGDSALQPFSLLALVTGINFDDIREFSRWAGDTGSKKRLLEEIRKGGVTPSYMNPSLHPVYKNLFKFMNNHQYGFSPLNALEITKATLYARREIHDIINALRSLGGIWKDIRLIATAEQIGIREARRIHGLYTVTAEDMIKGSRFDDAVCRVSGGINVHSLSMKDMEAGITGRSYSPDAKTRDYDIPLRSLIAKDVGGLMMAGRCISGDFLAHSSYRNSGNAVPMGQAAGRVAAVCSKKNIMPHEWSAG